MEESHLVFIKYTVRKMQLCSFSKLNKTTPPFNQELLHIQLKKWSCHVVTNTLGHWVLSYWKLLESFPSPPESL